MRAASRALGDEVLNRSTILILLTLYHLKPEEELARCEIVERTNVAPTTPYTVMTRMVRKGRATSRLEEKPLSWRTANQPHLLYRLTPEGRKYIKEQIITPFARAGIEFDFKV